MCIYYTLVYILHMYVTCVHIPHVTYYTCYTYYACYIFLKHIICLRNVYILYTCTHNVTYSSNSTYITLIRLLPIHACSLPPFSILVNTTTVDIYPL